MTLELPSGGGPYVRDMNVNLRCIVRDTCYEQVPSLILTLDAIVSRVYTKAISIMSDRARGDSRYDAEATPCQDELSDGPYPSDSSLCS